MGKLSGALALSLLCVLGCSKSSVTQNPASVDTSQVKSILLTTSSDQAATCEEELKASGANVIYRNDSGLLMTNRLAAELKLHGCKAEVNDNLKLDLNLKPAVTKDGEKLELSTLLRLIPAEEMGARSFIKNNPTFDGRDVIIAVLDTGIEVDHPMLVKTPGGEDKILDFQDFSGQGRTPLADVTVSPEGNLTLSEGNTYKSTAAGAGKEVKFGTFNGESLKYSEEISAGDKFVDLGVISYLNAEGKRVTRIDTNNDKNFDDETELHDYKVAHQFVKIGEKKTLTVSVTTSEKADAVTLSFDDGAHGTHVAGIAAGYEASGLQGVAPGAKVICGKIGDNRLAGGSTTTASMMLAIDFAVASKAHIVNLSYGIRAGGSNGKSAIDQYVDKIAKEKGMIFSISAGNEGPGLQTIGVPAAADLAITNGAYISKQTARDNYGYVAVEDDNTWYFSSVGPRTDGGWKPTLLSPGSALSSVPLWGTIHANYRGTSMASPQTSGGLALLISAAAQSSLATDRASITRAVYDGAKLLPNLSLVEQGHGLMNIPGALKALAAQKGKPVEYTISVNTPTSPNGRGKGIFVRSRQLPSNLFTVAVTPMMSEGQSPRSFPLRTLKMVPSATWISTPANMWVEGSAKSFQVELNRGIVTTPGLHSAKITAYDEADGSVAFELPVTVVSPVAMTDANQHRFVKQTEIKVGQTLRYFVDVPAGTTSVQVDLSSDGQPVWGQLLDSEGRLVVDIRDAEATAPMAPVKVQANITRPGVYELDVVAPPNNRGRAQVSASVQLFSLTAIMGPSEGEGLNDVLVQNNYEAVKVVPVVELKAFEKKSTLNFTGTSANYSVALNEAERKEFSEVNIEVATSQRLYDLMTDFPFRVFDAKGAMINSGGLELLSNISFGALDALPEGAVTVEISGAFTKAPPAKWAVQLREQRLLNTPQALSTGSRLLLEPGQQTLIPVDLSKMTRAPEGFQSCATLSLNDPAGRLIQSIPLCR